MERSDAEIECGGSAGDEDTAGGRMLMAGRSVEVLRILSRAETTRSWVGLEGLTPDEMPIIDRVAGVHLAAGFCGHGFAIGPVAGQLVSEWLLDGRPSLDLSAFVGGGAGPAGSAVALEEGHLAGLVVANRLGRLEGRAYSREANRARGRLLHLAGLRRVVDEMYRFGSGIYALAEDRTTLCRCEEVSAGEARAAVCDGATHVNEVKARTRIGMGRCQGRLCGPALAHVIAGASGTPVTEAGVFTPRPPAKPVSLAALANEAG